MNASEMAALLGIATRSVLSVTRVSGGDIANAFRVHTRDGPWFVKTQAPTFASAFAAEADALQTIAATKTIRVPVVRGQGSHQQASWLALEWLDLRPFDASGAAALGESLALMHRVSADQHGWQTDNFIGTTAQSNCQSPSWPAFFIRERLGVQLASLRSAPAASSLITLLERAIDLAPARFSGHDPAPSLLHGDLWAGNCAMLASGAPVLFDPAAYYGDRETDLAMTELFGGFHAAFYSAYNRAWPLDAGYEQRCGWYQLYHVLNHVSLFGGAYVQQAQALLSLLTDA